MYNGLPPVECLEAWGVKVDTLGTYNEWTLIWLDESRLSCKSRLSVGVSKNPHSEDPW